MTAVNVADVEDQLEGAGLVLPGPLEVNTAKPIRCRIKGEGYEKRGWYWLSEIPIERKDAGGPQIFVVGSYGIYRGNDSGKTRIQLPKDDARALTPEQRAAIKARHDENARRVAAELHRVRDRAARRAQHMWSKCATEGESGYLRRKQVGAYGIRFTPQGALVVPMLDATGKIWGLQFILDRDNPKHARRLAQTKRDKEYWPKDLGKLGHYHLIGGLPVSLVLIAEGYATAASVYAATGLPVAVAFDAGNLLPVAQALHKRYPRARILICADDDYLRTCHAIIEGTKCGAFTVASAGECHRCGAPLDGNPGIILGGAAALAVGGEMLAPLFKDPRATDAKGPTDFNDLQLLEGLHLVRAQIEAKLEALGWRAGEQARGEQSAGAKRERLKSLLTIDEACDRYVIIYGGKGTIFDRQEHMLVPKSDVLDLLPSRAWDAWKERGAQRRIARIDQVGFDPTGSDPNVVCNLWGGWPTQPKSGACDNLLDLLRYLCGQEDNAEEIYTWAIKWLAYPLQHPGAKMKTALVFHGPQGVGKNLFFEAIMAIYGEYGRMVDQHALEDKFNDWASRKLFLLADEVVARTELFHTKNKLKAFITGDWIRINPKNVAAHEERNHVNIVFLSNETQPLILERDDRRYTVIWTPGKLPRQVYQDVSDEIDAGGVAALHHYLVHLDLGDFKPWTEPPMTKAKAELIDLGMDSTERFWRAWRDGHIERVPFVPCKSEQLFALYRAYCAQQGIKNPAPLHHLLAAIYKRTDARRGQARYLDGSSRRLAAFVFPAEADQPLNKTQEVWLGECVREFGLGMENWRQERQS